MATLNMPPKLCIICRRIDFSQFMPYARLQFPDTSGVSGEPEVAFGNGIYIRQADGTLQTADRRRKFYHEPLYSLDDVVSNRAECSLCSFIATMFEKTPEREASSLPDSATWQGNRAIYLSSIRIGYIVDHSKDLPYEIALIEHTRRTRRTNIQRGWRLTGLEFTSLTENMDAKSFAALLAASPSENTAGRPSLLGRCQSALCDVSQYKSWLRMCTEGHPECTPNTDTGTHPLRLIDVKNMCLVVFHGDEKLGMKYLALSYVWGGGSKDFVLTGANMEDYCRYQGLPALPKTISDAILLTSRMQVRYLWVDSLGIISDDPQDKATQIPAMTSIYGCALLTIVAAAGEDAHNGLPGLRVRRLETNQANIGNYHIVQSHMPYSSARSQGPVPGTKWASRGWTYQELLLSPRSLIFLDEEVLWNCRCAQWFEEFDFEHPYMTFRWDTEEYHGATSLTVENYPTLVSDYTVRELTFEKDIVDAFRGIMEAIPDDFFWGFPLSKFGQYFLNFLPLAEDDRGYIKRDCELQLPSWSWFAWKGRIELEPNKSLLTIYRWQKGQLQQICARDESLNHESVLQKIWSDPSAWMVRLEDIPDGVVMNENQLIFWAPVTPVSDSDPEAGDWALCGLDKSGSRHGMTFTWHNNIARCEGSNGITGDVAVKKYWWNEESWYKNWLKGKVVRKLIILE